MHVQTQNRTVLKRITYHRVYKLRLSKNRRTPLYQKANNESTKIITVNVMVFGCSWSHTEIMMAAVSVVICQVSA